MHNRTEYIHEDFSMEELLPLVSRLAEKYTSLESTSVTYEQARQFMEAVLYCIREAGSVSDGSSLLAGKPSASQAYETGVACVKNKVQLALSLYNELAPAFCCYNNRCLYASFTEELPEFFQKYDVTFAPQDTIVMPGYPVLKDISQYTGIDRISEFISCIRLEQYFLEKFSEHDVIEVLSRYNPQYQDMADNLCEILFMVTLCHVLAKKTPITQQFQEKDYMCLKEILAQKDLQSVQQQLSVSAKKLVQKEYDGNQELFEYLSHSIHSVAVRLKNAARQDALRHIL